MLMKHSCVSLLGVTLAALSLVGGRAWGQDPMLSPPPVTQIQTAPAAQPSAPTPPAPKPLSPKKGKVPYSGPTNVIAQEPTPMLDGEGRQRIDPEGKPMFNPAVNQQRDKQGHPLLDDKGQPVFQTATNRGFDEKGHKITVKKEKAGKTIAVSITRGTLTVDGMIGKAALNYEISDLKYVYLYAPWIGTAVVSNVAFPGSKEQRNAFDQHTLTVTVEDHTFQLFSEKVLLGKKPVSAFVLVDRDLKLPSQGPILGYGATLKAPYTWPGAKANAESKTSAKAPPVPANLRPTQLLPPCPAGQMRQVAQAAVPGEMAPDQPCVPIGTRKTPAPQPIAPLPAPAGAPLQ